MALPMDEQRILAEIEQHLVHDDPSLAGRLATFERRRWRWHGGAEPQSAEPSTMRHRLRIAALVVVGLCVAGIVAAVLAAVLRPSTPTSTSTDSAAPAFVTTPVNHLPHGQQVPIAAN